MATQQIAPLAATTRQPHRPPVGYRCTTFTPAEAEAITGLSCSRQRQMRKRGQLQAVRGRRFTLATLCYFQALRVLADRGGPALALHAASACSWGIAWHVLAWPNAYQGDHERILSWDPAAAAQIEEWRAATAFLKTPGLSSREIVKEMRRIGPTNGHGWGLQADWLRHDFFSGHGVAPNSARYFVWWADNTVSSHNSLDAAFEGGLSSNPAFAGAVLVLDLRALATELLDRAGRAFITVEISPKGTP